MGGLLKILGSPLTELVKGVGGVIDSVTTTKEEKLSAQAKLLELQSAFTVRLTELDTQFAAEQAKVIIAEATSESWLTRNWRPLLMLTFTYIIAHNHVIAPLFGVESVLIVPDMWALLKLGMGGYIGGRSAEYVAQQAKEAFVAAKTATK
jgi:hypothetical protein